MSDFEAKVYKAEDVGLSEKERSLVETIGKENPDYCAAAILQRRYPDRDIVYHESDSAFEIDGERMEIDFELMSEEQEQMFPTDEEHGWISEVVLTLEMLFELGDPVTTI